jgi:hypothetical protein
VAEYTFKLKVFQKFLLLSLGGSHCDLVMLMIKASLMVTCVALLLLAVGHHLRLVTLMLTPVALSLLSVAFPLDILTPMDVSGVYSVAILVNFHNLEITTGVTLLTIFLIGGLIPVMMSFLSLAIAIGERLIPVSTIAPFSSINLLISMPTMSFLFRAVFNAFREGFNGLFSLFLVRIDHLVIANCRLRL